MPSGTLTAVFTRSAERQGSTCFLLVSELAARALSCSVPSVSFIASKSLRQSPAFGSHYCCTAVAGAPRHSLVAYSLICCPRYISTRHEAKSDCYGCCVNGHPSPFIRTRSRSVLLQISRSRCCVHIALCGPTSKNWSDFVNVWHAHDTRGCVCAQEYRSKT